MTRQSGIRADLHYDLRTGPKPNLRTSAIPQEALDEFEYRVSERLGMAMDNEPEPIEYDGPAVKTELF